MKVCHFSDLGTSKPSSCSWMIWVV